MDVVAAIRIGELMTILIRHIHDLAPENALTVDEQKKGIELTARVRQMTNDNAMNHESQLVCGIIGFES